MNKDSHLVVIYGGRSTEREVSLRSGKNVYEALMRLGYTNAKLLEFSDSSNYDWIQVLTELKKNKKIDLAIPMTHGTYGEDGALQGLLELLDIPYLGSNLEASAIGMNKVRTKEILSKYGLPVLETLTVRKLLANPQFPVIIKPSCGGSSVGVSKISSSKELEEWLQNNSESTWVDYLVESFITGIELTTSIIQVRQELDLKHSLRSENLYSLPLLELRPKNEFYDYQAKYTKGMTEFVCPAELTEVLTNEIHHLALETFRLCGLRNMARVDFIIDKVSMKPYILEVNTLPGMTDTSDLPYQASVAGLGYDVLVELLVNA